MKTNKIFKNSILSFLLILGSTMVFAQQTAIPDRYFEQALIDLGYDTGTPNGFVPTANINTITTLDVSQKSIRDLTGIEDFIALQTLLCGNNELTSLNVSNNVKLETLHCKNNQLTSLNLSTNVLLKNLDFGTNQITRINVSMLPKLVSLVCSLNQLTKLDVSKNKKLIGLLCGVNRLGYLDLRRNPNLSIIDVRSTQLKSLLVNNGNNRNITTFLCSNNPKLKCVVVDNPKWSTANWTNKDSQTNYYKKNCSKENMLQYRY
ncbi:hypothetical protein [Lutibacter sp.]